MYDLLQNSVAFIVGLGFLVAFHEFGHFYVAKVLGVKVLRYSVGFGRIVYSRRAGGDQTEFAVSAIPLGGYVKMLDEREGPVSPTEAHRAFNRQSLRVRTAIVAAGPLANLLLAVLLFWVMFISGVSGPRPLIDRVEPGSVAATAGLRAGDEILAVNGRTSSTWESVINRSLGSMVEGKPFSFSVSQPGEPARVVTLNGGAVDIDEVTLESPIVALGLVPLRTKYAARIGRVVPGGAAEAAGMLDGDLVLAADGEPVEDWLSWVALIRERPNQTFEVEVQRDEAVRTILVSTGARDTDSGQTIGFIGAEADLSEPMATVPLGIERHAPVPALLKAFERTWDTAINMLRLLRKIVVGEASTKNINGPIFIAEVAGKAVDLGVNTVLVVLASLSISLGVLNLLPVPMLDGGHLLYYLIEFIGRRPVSMRVQQAGQQVGLLLIAGLMSLAFYNDLARFW